MGLPWSRCGSVGRAGALRKTMKEVISSGSILAHSPYQSSSSLAWTPS